MKIPKTFLLEKDLENKVEDLKSQKKNKIKSLNDLVLWRDSEDFMSGETLPVSILEKEYPYLDFNSVCNNYCVKYDDVVLHILEFVEPSYVKDNKKSLKKCLDIFNNKSMYAHRCLIIKDNYAVFIHTFLGAYYDRKKFVDAYRKMFGFREVKQ